MSSRAKTTKVETKSGLPSAGDVLEDRYEVVRVIGEGGMGVVVKALDRRLDRPVALKLMHSHLARNKDFARRFEQEVLIAKNLNHPNTVRLYDFGTTSKNEMYLVMEYLDGRELRDVMQQGPMAIGRVIHLGTQLLDGLAEAHAIDVVHRDLKPGNIFICKDRRNREVVKILDFGIAKSIGEAQQAITNTGQVIGTAPYLAPELYLSDNCTLAADVYAVGLLMLEMLFGRKVVDAPTIGQLMSLHLHMPVILPPSLQKTALAPVLHRAVTKNVRQRYQSADEMLEELQDVVISNPDAILPPGEIDSAFGKMKKVFEENHARIIEGSPISGGMRQGTMVLDEHDLEILYAKSETNPTNIYPSENPPTAATTPVGRPDKPPITEARNIRRISRVNVDEISGSLSTMVRTRSALIVGSIAAVLSVIAVFALMSPGDASDVDEPVAETPQETSASSTVYEFIPTALDDSPRDESRFQVPAEEVEELEEPEVETEEEVTEEEVTEEVEESPPEPVAREEPRRQASPPPRQPRRRSEPTRTPSPAPAAPEPEEEEKEEQNDDVFDSILDRVLED